MNAEMIEVDERTQTRLLKAALYIRVSTKEQAEEGASLEAQEDVLRRWAEREELDVLEPPYIDDVSAKDLDRAAMDRLRRDAADGKFNVILFYHNDRMSRNTQDALQIVKEFYDQGINCRFFNFDVDLTTPEGEMLFTMLAAFSRYFLRDLGRKTSLGMQKRKEQGAHIGRLSDQFERIDPNRPLTSDNVRVKPDCKDLVENIYIGYDRGDSARSLAKQYDLGKASGHKTVKRIVEMVEWLKGGPNAIKFI